jgi:drug/metabolite transporter (DMT)-like permease
MTWFSFSLLSISALAFAELTQQHLLGGKINFNERTSAVLTFLTESIFVLPIILFTSLKFSFFDLFTAPTVYYLLLSNFLSSIAMIFYLRSFKVKNLSISTILISFSIFISTIIGIIFFHESTSYYKFLGLALIVLAIIVLKFRNLQIERNHAFGLLAGILFGVVYGFDKFFVIKTHPLIYMFWAFLLIAVFGTLLGPITVFSDIKGRKLSDFKPILLSGFGYSLFNLFTFFSYKMGGEIGRVDAINNAQTFIIIGVEFLVFKNTKGLARKVITALVAFSGVLILGFY